MASLLDAPPQRGARRAPCSPAVLAVILACQLMLVLDVTVILTGLPHIQSALGFSDASLSWVQNAYTLTFGGLLLLGARAGDILGRRRTFVAGIALFTAASAAGGLAQTPSMLLAARALQGIGAAVAAPSTLALLTTSFREGRERVRAVAYYSAITSAGGSVGLVLGGMVTDWISWRWGLFLNVPIGIALIVLAPRLLPETERRAGRFDLLGALSSTLGMTALVYGFVRAGGDGWGDRLTVASFVAAIALLSAFVATELRAPQPIVPLRLFGDRRRSGAYAVRLLLVSGNFSSFFFMTQYLQGVLGLDALQAGLAFLPMTIVMFATGRAAPALVPRLGTTRLLVAGLAGACVGLAWLSRVDAGSSYFPHVALAMVVFGAGTGLAMTPLTAAGLEGVAPTDAGAASGLLNVSQQLGGSLGLGILVSVFASAGGATALAHGVAAALTGSVVFLALAIAVVLLVMRPRGERTALRTA